MQMQYHSKVKCMGFSKTGRKKIKILMPIDYFISITFESRCYCYNGSLLCNCIMSFSKLHLLLSIDPNDERCYMLSVKPSLFVYILCSAKTEMMSE